MVKLKGQPLLQWQRKWGGSPGPEKLKRRPEPGRNRLGNDQHGDSLSRHGLLNELVLLAPLLQS